MDLKLFLRAQWDRVAACGLAVLGAVALLLGWLGISDTALTAEQLPYLVSGGLGGIALIGVGATLWLSADLRDEWRRIDRLERDLFQFSEITGDSEISAGPVPNVKHVSENGAEGDTATITSEEHRAATGTTADRRRRSLA